MGNEAFSAGNFAEAENQYSEALQSEGGLPADVKLTLLTNRATARFRARKFDGSLEDCDAALAIKPGHVKALYLPCISPVSPLYLPCISPVSRHQARPC